MAAVWEQVGSPLRPGAEDQQGYGSFIFPWLERFTRTRALILGVTPELYHLPWPADCDLLSLDHNRAMIDTFWPGAPESAIEGNWLRMPLPSSSREIAVCDGGLILLKYPDGQRKLAARLHDVLIPGGRCVFRLFVPGRECQSLDGVLDAFRSGRLANLNILKRQLATALQRSPEEGVAVQDFLRAVESVDADLNRLADRVGWPREHLRAIEAYRDSPGRYCYPTEAEISAIFCADYRFTKVGRWEGTYALAEDCPIIAFQRKD